MNRSPATPPHAGEGQHPRPTNFGLVQQFHAKFDPDPAAYTDLFGRRLELLNEEVSEIAEAVAEVKDNDGKKSRAHLVKEICDVLYVCYGTLELLRVDADAAFAEVHRSNMSKTPDTSGGKPLKVKGYQPAEMEQFV